MYRYKADAVNLRRMVCFFVNSSFLEPSTVIKMDTHGGNTKARDTATPKLQEI